MTYANTTFEVQIEAGIHHETREVFANFFSIDPSTSLPPAANDLSSLVKLSALQAVHDALGPDGSAGPRRGPGRPRKNAVAVAAPRAGKRTSESVQAKADQVLGYIKKNEGQRLEQISKVAERTSPHRSASCSLRG